MAEHPIQGIMNVTMDKIHEMVDANTIIGTPIQTGDVTLIPVSRLSFGIASGGSRTSIAAINAASRASGSTCASFHKPRSPPMFQVERVSHFKSGLLLRIMPIVTVGELFTDTMPFCLTRFIVV